MAVAAARRGGDCGLRANNHLHNCGKLIDGVDFVPTCHKVISDTFSSFRDRQEVAYGTFHHIPETVIKLRRSTAFVFHWEIL